MMQDRGAHPAVDAFVAVLAALTQTAADLGDSSADAEEIQVKCLSLVEQIIVAKMVVNLIWIGRARVSWL